MKKLLKNDWFNLFLVFGLFIGTLIHSAIGMFIVMGYFITWMFYKID